MALNPLGKTFFPGARKDIMLVNYLPLRSRGDKDGNGGVNQKKLFFKMELTGDSVVGEPGWVGEAHDYMAEDDNEAVRVIFDNKRMIMPGMTIDVYATRETKARALLLTACQFSHFTMHRQGLEEKAKVWLEWQVLCPDPMQLHQWLHDVLHKGFCAVFEQGQKTMEFEDDDKDDTQAKLPGYDGENANTMDASRDAEFKSPGTRKGRSPAAVAN
jgi:hypothetical protein